MAEYLVADFSTPKEKEKQIVDWYNKTMEYFLSKHGKVAAEDYHNRMVYSLKNHPTFLKCQHLSRERIEEKLSHQFSLITAIPVWVSDLVNNFASSYQGKLISRIKKKLNCDNLDEFTTIVLGIHSDLIEEEMAVHSYKTSKKLNIKKSFLENSVREKLKHISQLNLILYAEYLEFEFPTIAIEDFVEKFYAVERKSRKRFLKDHRTEDEDFLSFAKTLLDLMAVKCCAAFLPLVFSREIDCRIDDNPLTETEFDCAAEEVMSKCIAEFKRGIKPYTKEVKTTQNASERLTMSLLKEIKSHKTQNRKAYLEKYNVVSYYDY